MSADNWRECPQCRARNEQKNHKAVSDLEATYGEIPADEWLAKKEAVENPPELNETLREDYEFHIDEQGGFCAKYHGSCEICGFEFSFKHEEQLKIVRGG